MSGMVLLLSPRSLAYCTFLGGGGFGVGGGEGVEEALSMTDTMGHADLFEYAQSILTELVRMLDVAALCFDPSKIL